MFTGIVQAKCPVLAVESESTGLRLTVDLQSWTEGLQLGASVAVNGVCLTVSSMAGDRVAFDVIHETLARTNLRHLAVGDLINVERSARFSDEIGGHRVSGHISGVADLLAVDRTGGSTTLTLVAEPSQLQFLFHKGFVALNGASLTISALRRDEGQFDVSLIPETLLRTTFGTINAGALINLEVDALTQAVVETVHAMMRERGEIGPLGGNVLR